MDGKARYRDRLKAGISAFALLMALTGCTSAQQAAAGCDVKRNDVHESTGSPGWMHGKVTAKCKGVSLSSISATTQLQRYTDGEWVNYGRQKLDPRGALSAGKQITFYTRSVACTTGKWRYWVQVTGTGRGYTHSTPVGYSNTRINPCD